MLQAHPFYLVNGLQLLQMATAVYTYCGWFLNKYQGSYSQRFIFFITYEWAK